MQNQHQASPAMQASGTRERRNAYRNLAIEKLEAHNDDFRAQENEEQLLAVYFDVPLEGSGTFMTTAEISDKLVIKGSIKKPMPLNRLGMVLKKAGFQSKMVGTTRTRGWIVRERDTEEINANRNIEGRT